MNKFVKIILPRGDVNQIIEDLTQRMLIWRATAEYMETGYPQSADCVEKCSDEHEADVIADHYQFTMDQIIKQLERQQDSKTHLFFHLIHGRKDPNQDMDDWGFDGPIFGPYIGLHCTYCNYVRLTKVSGHVDELHIKEELVYYDNCYYGDWFITTEHSIKDKLYIYEPSKAEPPHKN